MPSRDTQPSGQDGGYCNGGRRRKGGGALRTQPPPCGAGVDVPQSPTAPEPWARAVLAALDGGRLS